MRLLVTGPRTWGVATTADRAAQAKAEMAALFASLDELRPSVLIHGGAAGADTWAGRWAECHNVQVRKIIAPFKMMGPVAGRLRNTYMLEHGRPKLVLACGSGGTPGTDNCVSQALLLGIPVRRVLI